MPWIRNCVFDDDSINRCAVADRLYHRLWVNFSSAQRISIVKHFLLGWIAEIVICPGIDLRRA